MLASVVQKGSHTDFWGKINFEKKRQKIKMQKAKYYVDLPNRSGKTILMLWFNKISLFYTRGRKLVSLFGFQQSTAPHGKLSVIWENVALVQKL